QVEGSGMSRGERSQVGITEGDIDRTPSCLPLRALERNWGNIRSSDAVSELREPDRLCSDTASRVEYRSNAAVPKFATYRIKLRGLAPDARIPVGVDQVVEGRKLVVELRDGHGL